ncbi:putative kinase-like protein TMKL1 [Capsicum annuum]|uniref:Kinase-like protein TMKL1 n=1 Tax=Capsicum annuum TaxID=4072 RepID=A0A2G2YSV1_CAPAN|nr:putative kinase-like protein TMKL1 [Capsicum annuum]PHT72764.1 putative kinase-like protein TMKL1 [Capsicum annuum]
MEHFSSPLSMQRNPSLHLVSLELSLAILSGTLPRELGELSTLQSLYLGVNPLHGTIPLDLGYNFSRSDIELSGNTLSGTLPASIWNICEKLVSLKIYGNYLSGSLPNPALPDATCKSLQYLDLGKIYFLGIFLCLYISFDFGKNIFSGNFPMFISKFNGLKELDLGGTNFSRPVPETLAALKLEKLNLSHNNFSGMLPNFGESKFGMHVFEGNNPTLCGHPLGPYSGSSGLSPFVITGIVIALMTALVVVASLLIGYFQGKWRKHADEAVNKFEKVEEEEAGCGEGKLILFQGGEHLTPEDMLNGTGQVMEKTSYVTIYKEKLADGGTIALRLLREGSCKGRSTCLTVIRQLGRV